jgi:hypothetical protein
MIFTFGIIAILGSFALLFLMPNVAEKLAEEYNQIV